MRVVHRPGSPSPPILRQKLPQVERLRQGREEALLAASLPGALRTAGRHYDNAASANRGRGAQPHIRHRAAGLVEIHILRRIDLRNHDVVLMLDGTSYTDRAMATNASCTAIGFTCLHGDRPALAIEHDVDDKLQANCLRGIPHEPLKGITGDLSSRTPG